MKLIIVICVLTLSLFGQGIFGLVSKIKGEAFEITQDEGTILLKVGDEVHVNSTVFTKDKSRLIIKFEEDVIVLNQNCKLFLDEKSSVTQEGGSIFYKINPVNSFTKVIKELSQNRFKIKTNTSTIGIRGTNFIVATDTDQKIFLRGGKLNITSVNEEFKMYKKQVLDDFNAYKQKQNKEFSEFVKTQEYEFDGYKKEFTLEQNRYVSIVDGKVYQKKFSKEVDLVFKELDSFISD